MEFQIDENKRKTKIIIKNNKELVLEELSWITKKLNLNTEKMLRNQLSPVPLR